MPAAAPAPSAESRALERHYARVQADLLARGLMRRDGGGRDAPWDARVLADNFLRIALYDEYAEDTDGSFVARQTESRLRRWDRPVRLQLRFGASVPPAARARDRAALEAYAGRLARAARHPVALLPEGAEGGNFHVLVLSEDERRAIGPDLRRLVPGISPAAVEAITDMPRSFFCLALAFARGDAAVYGAALAVVRAEHPDLMRLSCLHEEVAQGLGLANDSPEARPSIFNDDEEFALLTTHDEYLLRLLYDRRLRPGMTAAEAVPIVRDVAREMRPGPG